MIKKGGSIWLCECSCGTRKEMTRRTLISGNTKSCGCLKRDVHSETHITHGMTESPEYYTWCRIKYRCYNEKSKDYPDYGGRGIKMCERWLESFENFYEDMGERPSLKHSIERLDVNGDYSPENCIWTTYDRQARNQRKFKSNTTGVTGVYQHHKNGVLNRYVADWRELNGTRKTKSFSINKYGKEEAFRLACQAREDAIKRLNEEGAGYSENHGK